MQQLLDDALSRGARIVNARAEAPSEGTYFAPAVLTDVPSDARVLHEEIFGPLAPIVVFEHEEEAIAAANDTEFGLAAYAFTTNDARRARLIERLDTGMVGINRGLISDAAASFGGVKQSGLGREGGSTGLHEYIELQYLAECRTRHPKPVPTSHA